MLLGEGKKERERERERGDKGLKSRKHCEIGQDRSMRVRDDHAATITQMLRKTEKGKTGD